MNEQAVNKVALLRCPNPWCFAKGDPLVRLGALTKLWSVTCACGVWGPSKTTEAEARSAWNERPAITAYEAEGVEPLRKQIEELREALRGCNGVQSGPNGYGGMRVICHFDEPGKERALFTLLANLAEGTSNNVG